MGEKDRYTFIVKNLLPKAALTVVTVDVVVT
jgi:hypothetical protein